jgi:hypothetical protein
MRSARRLSGGTRTVRLNDLFPRWIHPNVFMFLCPHCGDIFLTCKNVPMDHNTQWALFDALYERYPGIEIVGCREAMAWSFPTGADFETISVTPSLDASAAGHWHGFITAGAIV